MKKLAQWQRLTTLLLVSVMVLSLFVGCKKEEAAPTATEETTTTETVTEEPNVEETETVTEEVVAGMEGWTPFAEKVKIRVPVYDRSKEGYPAVDNNYWTQWVQKEFGDKYNVEVEYVAIPRSDVMTKYSLLIAGEETPTIMMEYDYPKVTQWANDGAMQEINLEQFKQVAPNYYQKMVDNDQLMYTDVNGKTFFVLTERPFYDASYTYATFIRKDWLDQVGLAIPKSYAEYTKALDAFVAAGITDQPLGLRLPSLAYVTNFPFRETPVNEEEWAMHSSLGTASLPWEPTMKYLKRLNSEYNKGYFSSEYDLDLDGNQEKADFINGKTYQYGGYMSANVDWLTSFYEKNPDAKLAVASAYAVVEPGVVEHPVNRADNPFGMIVGFSSLATEEQLTAAWMYMEWMMQPEVLFTLENGVEGVTYTVDANGLPIVNGDYRGEEMLNHNNNIDMTCVVHASKVIGTAEESIGAVTPQGIPQDFKQELIDTYKETRAIADSGWAYTDPIFAVALESESEYNASLLSLYKEYSVELVKCKPEEFDTIYAELSQKYLDAGYQEIIDERLAAYKENKTTKLPK